MNTDELDQIIKDYLTAIDTDYAIMVSGDWGSGKSYYITHILSPQLKSIFLPAIKGEYKRTWLGNNKKRYYSLAYISLYGLSSVVDFEVRVFNGINSWINHRLIRTLGLLGSKAGEYFGVSLWEKDAKAVTFIGSDRVLVFDDLERICEDKISVKEVLGLINSYAEHSHLKVIIVCNEKHFLVDGEDNKAQTDYQTYKEKCVRFTYKFVPDVSVVYDAIINKIGNVEYKSYLLKEKTTLLSLFDVGGKRNLRTLKFIIDSFEKIYLLSHYSKYKEKVFRTYLVTFMLYSCEYKQGRHAEELNTLEIGKNKVDINSYAWRGMSYPEKR